MEVVSLCYDKHALKVDCRHGMVSGQTENIGLWAVNGFTLEAPAKWQARKRPKGVEFKHILLWMEKWLGLVQLLLSKRT